LLNRKCIIAVPEANAGKMRKIQSKPRKIKVATSSDEMMKYQLLCKFKSS